MTELESYLESLIPELKNVTRLFALPDELWDGEQPRFAYAAWEADDQYRCRVTGEGREIALSTDIPNDEDERLRALHRKRALRRMIKQAAYDLCRDVTGVHPPWGSLTGIRPTHLIYEAMGEGMSRQEAAEAVMRRFDVTAEKAALLSDIVAVQQTMPDPDDSAMDVYIGIPFCTTRCTYCSFSSGEIGRGKLVEPYLAALFREMEDSARLLKDSGKYLRALYVGGGTPTSLNEDQLARLLDHMMRLFPGAIEYTVEAGRPDTITPGKLQAIKAAGVGRISINPQTMVDRTLRVIGRAHTAQQVEEAYAMARAADMRHINMDVIAGLPGENAAHFANTMDRIRALEPDSLTVHTLAIKRSSRLNLEKYPLPDAAIAAEMVRLGAQTADELGLEPYYLYRQKYMAGQQQNVGYARPGKACLYNIDIMEETTTILAMGAGAISKRVFPDRELRIERAPNVTNVCVYIDRVQEMARRKEILFMEREEHQ